MFSSLHPFAFHRALAEFFTTSEKVLHIKNATNVFTATKKILASVVPRMMAEKRQTPMEKFTLWKFFLRHSDEKVFAQKVSAIGDTSNTPRVAFSFAYDGMKVVKMLCENHIDSGSFNPLHFPLFVILIFQTGHDPTARHASETGMKCLKAVYIIPTTFSSNEEIMKLQAERRSQVTSKALRLADSVTNSKIYFHLYRRNSFSPRFLPCFACITFLCASHVLAVEIVE